MTRMSYLGGMLVFLAVAQPALGQAPLSTQLTYQGRLDAAGVPASGPHDFQFTLFDAAAGGTAVGPVLCVDGVEPTDGLFTIPLDFGNVFTGDQRFLQVAVRSDAAPGNCTVNTGTYTVLAPRQPLTAAPYASFAPAANALHAPSGGPANAAFVDAFGGLVLGQTSSLKKQDSGGVARSLLVLDGGDNLQLLAPPDRTMAFRTGTGGSTTVRATLTAGGRLGIGTADPDVLLHLQSGTPGDSGVVTASNLLLERGGDNYLSFMSPPNRLSGLAFGRPGATATELIHGAITYNEATLPDAMQFKTGGNLTRMTIDATGEVGIGTTAPADPLHIVNALDATVRLERTGGSTLLASAQASAGQVGTSTAFPLQLITNGAARLTVGSTGNVGINTTSPSARLHVVDAAGGNGTVVLPSSSVGSAEILDEPGVAGLFHTGTEVDITAFFPDPPQSVLSQTITAPAAGYVLAIATVGATSFTLDASQSKWGLTMDSSMPPAELGAMMLVEFQPTPQQAGYWSTPVTLHRLFPVAAGAATVHVMAQQYTGTWEFDRAMLTLVFIPTLYGSAPAPLNGGGDGEPQGVADVPGAGTAWGIAEYERLRDEIAAERAGLQAELAALRALRTELERLRDGSGLP